MMLAISWQRQMNAAGWRPEHHHAGRKFPRWTDLHWLRAVRWAEHAPPGNKVPQSITHQTPITAGASPPWPIGLVFSQDVLWWVGPSELRRIQSLGGGTSERSPKLVKLIYIAQWCLEFHRGRMRGLQIPTINVVDKDRSNSSESEVSPYFPTVQEMCS